MDRCDRVEDVGCAGVGSSPRGFVGEIGADLYRQAQTALIAVRLTQLGARAGLVRRLTGLEKKVANRLYRQLHGKPSPSGLMPFTDTWFLQDRRRMLHAGVIWKLYERLTRTRASNARIIVEVYEGYLRIVDEPLLDLTRAYFVSQLVQTRAWHARECSLCHTGYIAPVEEERSVCPGCERYQRFRCPRCGTALVVKAKGRHRVLCEDCRQGSVGVSGS